MQTSITPEQIRIENGKRIYQYIYRHREVSQQNIADLLHLSRPTVAARIQEMAEEGMIQISGQITSDTIGRNPNAYSIVPDYRLAISVEILSRRVKIASLNLYGEYVLQSSMNIQYENHPSYYRSVALFVLEFIASNHFTDDRILGIGFVLPALVSSDGTYCHYGTILNCTGISIDVFQRYIRFPCRFLHDANSAALTELWHNPRMDNAIYLLLSYHMGAATILDRGIYFGKHGHGTTLEHIITATGTKKCYCGNYGCFETICSIDSLTEDTGLAMEEFFTRLRAQDPESLRHWDAYLDCLAQLITNVHLVYDIDFVLGGYLAEYLLYSDVEILYHKISSNIPFDLPHDFLKISNVPHNNILPGGGLLYIKEFLDENLG